MVTGWDGMKIDKNARPARFGKRACEGFYQKGCAVPGNKSLAELPSQKQQTLSNLLEKNVRYLYRSRGKSTEGS